MRVRKPKSNRNNSRTKSEVKESLPISQAISYSSRRSEETFNVGRKEQKKKPKFTSRFGLLQRALLAAILIFVVIIIYRVLDISTNPRVIPVYPSNQPVLQISSLGEYKAYAKKLFTSSIWNQNKITVNTSDIEKKMKLQYPEIESVSVSIAFLSSVPKIYIEPALPSFILKSNNNLYYSLDINGRAIAESSNPQTFASTSNSSIVNDESGLAIKLNEQVIPSSYITFMETVIAQLKAKSISVSSLTLPPDSQELDVGIVGEPYYVKFNLEEGDPRQQAGTYIATTNLLKSEHITPTKYIDVRVDGRAYYE